MYIYVYVSKVRDSHAHVCPLDYTFPFNVYIYKNRHFLFLSTFLFVVGEDGLMPDCSLHDLHLTTLFFQPREGKSQKNVGGQTAKGVNQSGYLSKKYFFQVTKILKIIKLLIFVKIK